MGRSKPTVWTIYRCPDCGNHTEIQRLAGMKRPNGHQKNMWCVICRAERNFIQVEDG